jgi:hypothetical protein
MWLVKAFGFFEIFDIFRLLFGVGFFLEMPGGHRKTKALSFLTP